MWYNIQKHDSLKKAFKQERTKIAIAKKAK